jgi:two-component system NtrC family sensor kinase
MSPERVIHSSSKNPIFRLPMPDQGLHRPTLAALGVLLVLNSVALATRPPRPSAETFVIGAAIALLVLLGDRFAVHRPGGWRLTLAPVVLASATLLADWSLVLIAALIGSLRLMPVFSWRHIIRLTTVRSLIVSGSALIALGVPPAPLFASSLALAALVVSGYVLEMLVDPIDADRWQIRWRDAIGSLRWYIPVMTLIGALFAEFRDSATAVLPFALALLGCLQILAHIQTQQHRTHAELTSLREQLGARTERLERLQALTTAMLATLDDRRQFHMLCERLAALLDAEAGWITLYDQDGLRVPAVHGLTVRHPESAQVDRTRYHEIIQRGQIVLIADERAQQLAPVIDSDDPIRWSTLLVIPLTTDHGATGAICLAFEHLRGLDIEDRRILASFARQAAVAIENTRLFSELRQKQAELIQSSKLAAVGTFAAGIGHEFNNLLGGMLGYAELGRSASDSAEKDQALDVIRQACQRGRSITRGLLTFARRSEHRRDIHHLTDVIAETLTLVEVDLRKLNITLERVIEPTPAILCDSGQIAQVLLNLITNARDAIGQNGGTITVSLRQCGAYVELGVSDTGEGIPEHVRDRIFEPFVTTKGALGTSNTPGTGLGLSVSYGIVKDHGGDIRFETEIGVGTTMMVRLPINPPS